MSKRKEEKLNKSQLSTYHKNEIKENTKYIKHKRRYRNIIDKRNYNLSLIFLILLNIFGQALHHSQFLRQINYYSYITLKIKGIGNRNVFNNKQNEFPNSSYPDEIYINGNKQDIINYSYDFNQTYNDVKFIWNTNAPDPGYMFAGCSYITEVDLSHFDTSQATNFRYIFTDCISITSINLSNIDTSNAIEMYDMFRNCSSLTSLDLSSFDTSNVVNMQNFFADCISLSSLDLSSFNTAKVNNYAVMFKGCKNLEYINFKNFGCTIGNWRDGFFNGVPKNIVICASKNTDIITSKLSDSPCYVIDCRDDWKSVQKKVKGSSTCLSSCNDDSDYKNEYNYKCYTTCAKGILNDESNNSRVNECQCELDQCLKCPPVPLMKNMCTKCNVDYYQIEDDMENLGEYINCYKDPEGYYLDLNAEIYRRCYYTCKTCEIKGNNLYHNCKLCKEEYPVGIIFNDTNNYKNCYRECNNYYFFECENNHHCVIDSSSPNEYPIEIK